MFEKVGDISSNNSSTQNSDLNFDVNNDWTNDFNCDDCENEALVGVGNGDSVDKSGEN